MKKIKLSISDDFGNIDNNGSPIWRNGTRYGWQGIKLTLCLSQELVTRLRNWQKKAIEAKIPLYT